MKFKTKYASLELGAPQSVVVTVDDDNVVVVVFDEMDIFKAALTGEPDLERASDAKYDGFRVPTDYGDTFNDWCEGVFGVGIAHGSLEAVSKGDGLPSQAQAPWAKTG